jgi:hypothetical protein
VQARFDSASFGLDAGSNGAVITAPPGDLHLRCSDRLIVFVATQELEPLWRVRHQIPGATGCWPPIAFRRRATQTTRSKGSP